MFSVKNKREQKTLLLVKKNAREREIVKNILVKYNIRFADYDKYFTPSTMYHPSFDFSEIEL